MKKNVKKVVILLLIVTVAVGSYLIAGTFAKYTSEFNSGTGTAGVAKWSWIINNKAFTTAQSVSQQFTFNPFATIYDSNGSTEESDVDSTLIAPGTSGVVALDITNNSEVNAVYKVEFTVTNAGNVPLEYSLDNSAWTSDITTLNIGTGASNSANAPVAINMKGGTTIENNESTIKLYWRWAYERGTGSTLVSNDEADTGIGFGANGTRPTVTISAKVTATQVD